MNYLLLNFFIILPDHQKPAAGAVDAVPAQTVEIQ